MSSPATLASTGSAPQRTSRPRRYGGGPESPFSSRNVSLKSSPATLAGHTATTAADEGGSEWVVQGGGLADGSRGASGGGGVSLGAAAVPSAAASGGGRNAAVPAPVDDERFPRPATAGSYKPAQSGGHGSPNGVSSSSKSRGPSRGGAAGAAASPPGSPAGAAGMRSSSAVDPATSLADDDHKPIVAERFKTKMCKNWKDTGSCPYEIRCMFAHGDADFRTKEMNLAENLTTEEAVKVFQRGKSEKEVAAGGGSGGGSSNAAGRSGAKTAAGSAGGGRTSRNGPATPGLRGAATSSNNKSTASPRSATTKGNSGGKGGSVFDAGSPFGGGGHSSSRFEPLSPGGTEPRPPQPRSSQRSSAERTDVTPPTVHPQQAPLQQQQQQYGSTEKGDGLTNASFAAVTPGTAPSSASSAHGFTLLDGVANLPGSIKGAAATTTTTTTSTGPTGQHNTSGGSDYNFIRDHTATTSTRSGSQDQQQQQQQPSFAYDFGSVIAASNAQQQQSGQQHGSIAHTAATWGDPLRPSLLVPGSAGDATNSSTANQTPRNSMVGGGSSDVDPDDDELHRLVSAVLNQTA